MGINDIVFEHRLSNFVPTGKVWVFYKDDKFHVRSREKITTMQIVQAISYWIEDKEKADANSTT